MNVLKHPANRQLKDIHLPDFRTFPTFGLKLTVSESQYKVFPVVQG